MKQLLLLLIIYDKFYLTSLSCNDPVKQEGEMLSEKINGIYFELESLILVLAMHFRLLSGKFEVAFPSDFLRSLVLYLEADDLLEQYYPIQKRNSSFLIANCDDFGEVKGNSKIVFVQ